MHDAVRALCQRTLERHAATPLFAIPGRAPAAMATLRDFYLPLLVNYTHEDQAAKGLRSFKDASERAAPAVYFSALERVCAEQLVLLLGERGSGKTCFALHLALNLAGEAIGSHDFNLTRLRRPVPRNDHGMMVEEGWTGPAAVPIYLPAHGPALLSELLHLHAPEIAPLLCEELEQSFLLIVDNADRLGASGPDLLEAVAALAGRSPKIRVLVAGESGACRTWLVPASFRKYQLLPLLAAQRAAYRRDCLARHHIDSVDRADAESLGNPGLFALSHGLTSATRSPHHVVDRLLVSSGLGQADIERIVAAAFDAYAADSAIDAVGSVPDDPGLTAALGKTFVLAYLAARRLEQEPASRAAMLFHADPARWEGPIRILARRLIDRGQGVDALAGALASGDGDRGLAGAVLAALIVADTIVPGATPKLPPQIQAALLLIIEGGRLSFNLRAEAGRHLARFGDPRDLEALVDVPAGRFVMGSAMHPNSIPPHDFELAAFRIGRYPVTNRLYRQFIEATGRSWRSTDGRRAERANAPAVDLTWHDARACCVWLTAAWRASGKIRPDELVRLPTEPEWEYAARGAQPDRDAHIYPWRGAWQPDRENSEETGFNDTCTVGMFPKGRSDCGCDDMGGQVWEWTSTLWGEDMATPSWKYPYADDGRENAEAGPTIRRVLRGGCFSSGKEKACCTYRGSLEPNGFWRGNGFRVVVS